MRRFGGRHLQFHLKLRALAPTLAWLARAHSSPKEDCSCCFRSSECVNCNLFVLTCSTPHSFLNVLSFYFPSHFKRRAGKRIYNIGVPCEGFSWGSLFKGLRELDPAQGFTTLGIRSVFLLSTSILFSFCTEGFDINCFHTTGVLTSLMRLSLSCHIFRLFRNELLIQRVINRCVHCLRIVQERF